MAPQVSIDLARVKQNIDDIKEHLKRVSNGEKLPAHILAQLQRKIAYIEGLIERHKNLMDKTHDLTEKTKELQAKYKELSEVYVEILAEYNALKTPPHSYANFVRYLGEEEVVLGPGRIKKFPLIEVRNYDGVYRRVLLVNKDVKPHELKYGELLVINSSCPTSGGHVIAKAGEFDIAGEEAVIESVLGRDREGVSVLVKSGQMETVGVMHVSAGLAEELKPGKRVLVNLHAGLVIGILPDKESQKYLMPQVPKETFDDVCGLEGAIRRIKEDMIWPIIYPDLYERFGKPRFKGYVWHGPPGCGKTLLGKALANEMAKLLSEKYGIDIKGQFFYIGGTELLDKWVGNTEGFLREIFGSAENTSKKTFPPSPVLIIFDDAEVMFRTRGSAISSDVNESHVTQICTLLQGMEDRGNVIVIFLTNKPEMMDPAVSRHGRVSDVFHIPRPNRDGIMAMFRKYLKADWKVLHPKYNVDVYTPLKDGKPILAEGGKIKQLQFANDPSRVVDYLAENALKRMFGQSNEFRNELLAVQYAGDKDFTTLRYGDFVSGAIIAEGIMPKVLQMAINEAVELKNNSLPENTGVQMKFIYDAIEHVFESIRQTICTRSPEDLIEWLAVQGHKPRPIVRIRLPDGISAQKQEAVLAEDTSRAHDREESESDEDEGEEEL